jgi:hypothetical protein
MKFQKFDPPYAEMAKISKDNEVEIKYHLFDRDTLNNRFLPLKKPTTDDYLLSQYRIETEAILSIDDDVFIDCEHIEQGFDVWREHKYFQSTLSVDIF